MASVRQKKTAAAAATATATATAPDRLSSTAKAVMDQRGIIAMHKPASVFHDLTSQAERLTFRMAPTKVYIANSIIRAVIRDVETVGFDFGDPEYGIEKSTVKVHRYVGVPTSEELVHRICMVPIYHRSIADPRSVPVERLEFRMNIRNDSDVQRDVTTDDFEVYDVVSNQKLNTRDFFPVNRISKDPPLLWVLRPKRHGEAYADEIQLTAKAVLGTGSQYAGFMPACAPTAPYTVDTDPDHQNQLFGQWLHTHKKLELAGLADDRKADLRKEFNTMYIQRCYVRDAETGEPISFDVQLETVGPLPCNYIVYRALEILAQRLEQYAAIDDPLQPDAAARLGIELAPCLTMAKGVDMTVQGDTHTYGNQIQKFIVDYMMDVSYEAPHPLKNMFVLRFYTEREGSIAFAKSVFATAARSLAAYYRALMAEWVTVSGVSAAATASGSRPTATSTRSSTNTSLSSSSSSGTGTGTGTSRSTTNSSSSSNSSA
jgi:DNA-directed RNA polymerase subunit L